MVARSRDLPSGFQLVSGLEFTLTIRPSANSNGLAETRHAENIHISFQPDFIERFQAAILAAFRDSSSLFAETNLARTTFHYSIYRDVRLRDVDWDSDTDDEWTGQASPPDRAPSSTRVLPPSVSGERRLAQQVRRALFPDQAPHSAADAA